MAPRSKAKDYHFTGVPSPLNKDSLSPFLVRWLGRHMGLSFEAPHSEEDAPGYWTEHFALDLSHMLAGGAPRELDPRDPEQAYWLSFLHRLSSHNAFRDASQRLRRYGDRFAFLEAALQVMEAVAEAERSRQEQQSGPSRSDQGDGDGEGGEGQPGDAAEAASEELRAMAEALSEMESEGREYGQQPGSAHLPLRKLAWLLKNQNRVSKLVMDSEVIADAFRIARRLDTSLRFQPEQEGELAAAPTPADRLDVRPLRSLSELARILPSQNLLPDELFWAKAAAGELLMGEFQEPSPRRQVLYVLMDTSGSMGDPVRGQPNTSQWKIRLASGIALAYLLLALRRGNQYVLRPFDMMPHRSISARTKEEAAAAMAQLLSASFSGGGTDISHAVGVAMDDIEDIRTRDPKRLWSDILLITDCESSLRVHRETMDSHRIRLHIVALTNPQDTAWRQWEAECHTMVRVSGADEHHLESLIRNLR